ncbi:hypothetical protein MRB53_040091 [Persea americana]|nr:hypothetical protein MRB53_040091 [Persea americana]
MEHCACQARWKVAMTCTEHVWRGKKHIATGESDHLDGSHMPFAHACRECLNYGAARKFCSYGSKMKSTCIACTFMIDNTIRILYTITAAIHPLGASPLYTPSC